MESLLFHPKVVHLPMALAVLMPLVGGGIALAWFRAWLPRRSWLIALALQAALVAGAGVSMQSGEAEEERVEHVIAERHVEAHEEAAELFTYASVGVLGLFLLAAIPRRERLGLALAVAAVVGSVAVLGLGVRVGQAGGALVYEHCAACVSAHAGDVSSGPSR